MSPTALPRPAAARLRRSAAAVLRWVRGPLIGLAALALLFPPAHWFLSWLVTLPPLRAQAVALGAASIWICYWAARRAAHARSAPKPVLVRSLQSARHAKTTQARPRSARP